MKRSCSTVVGGRRRTDRRDLGTQRDRIEAETSEICMVPGNRRGLKAGNHTSRRCCCLIDGGHRLEFRSRTGGDQMFHPAGHVCRNRRTALVAGALLVNSQAGAGTACITCTQPSLSVRCEIRKSEAIEGLPFGQELLGKACAKVVKWSYSAHRCHAVRDTTCLDWPEKSFSLKEAKRALLGEAPPLPASEPQNPASQLPPDGSVLAPQNAFTTAWHKFIAFFTWH